MCYYTFVAQPSLSDSDVQILKATMEPLLIMLSVRFKFNIGFMALPSECTNAQDYD